MSASIFDQTGMSQGDYQKNTVFRLFRYHIMIEEKCHIYRFVEQMKLYRLVYKSINNIAKKNIHKYEHDIAPRIGKIWCSDRYSSVIISAFWQF